MNKKQHWSLEEKKERNEKIRILYNTPCMIIRTLVKRKLTLNTIYTKAKNYMNENTGNLISCKHDKIS